MGLVTKRERERERKRERTRNPELYYKRIPILGSCLFLQSVLANLHANRLLYKTTVTTLTAIVIKTTRVRQTETGETQTRRQEKHRHTDRVAANFCRNYQHQTSHFLFQSTTRRLFGPDFRYKPRCVLTLSPILVTVQFHRLTRTPRAHLAPPRPTHPQKTRSACACPHMSPDDNGSVRAARLAML